MTTGESLSPPKYAAKHYHNAIEEIRELAGDGVGVVSSAALREILERHGLVEAH
jgi:hypothetical protein